MRGAGCRNRQVSPSCIFIFSSHTTTVLLEWANWAVNRFKLRDLQSAVAAATFSSWSTDADSIGVKLREISEIDLPALSRIVSPLLLLDMVGLSGAAACSCVVGFGIRELQGHNGLFVACLSMTFVVTAVSLASIQPSMWQVHTVCLYSVPALARM